MSGAADRLVAAGAPLFAKLGFAGTSIRAISEAAGTNVNAISYHFGGKKGLYAAILGRLGGLQLASARRILGREPVDSRDLETRLLLYAEEVLATYLAEPEALTICLAELQQGFRNCDGEAVVEALAAPTDLLVKFLRRARQRGLVRKQVDPAMVAGTLMERIGNQVLFAEAIEATFGESIHSERYARRWTRQMVDLLLHGAARPDSD